MQVESQKAQRRRLPPLLRQYEGKQRDRDRKRQIVQRVMVVREPQKRVLRIAGEQLGNDAQPIDIGHNRRQRNLRPIRTVLANTQPVRKWTRGSWTELSVVSRWSLAEKHWRY